MSEEIDALKKHREYVLRKCRLFQRRLHAIIREWELPWLSLSLNLLWRALDRARSVFSDFAAPTRPLSWLSAWLSPIL
jgi:hypothetical protein